MRSYKMISKLEKIRRMRENQWTGDLSLNSINTFLGQDLSRLGIKIPQEHLTCQCVRSFRNNLKCVDHKQVFEYLNRSEMVLIDQLDQELQKDLINNKIKSLRK